MSEFKDLGLWEQNRKLKELGTPFIGNYTGAAVEVRYEPDRLVCRLLPDGWIFPTVLVGGSRQLLPLLLSSFFPCRTPPPKG